MVIWFDKVSDVPQGHFRVVFCNIVSTSTQKITLHLLSLLYNCWLYSLVYLLLHLVSLVLQHHNCPLFWIWRLLHSLVWLSPIINTLCSFLWEYLLLCLFTGLLLLLRPYSWDCKIVFGVRVVEIGVMDMSITDIFHHFWLWQHCDNPFQVVRIHSVHPLESHFPEGYLITGSGFWLQYRVYMQSLHCNSSL